MAADLCPNCGAPGDGLRFCRTCGTALIQQCPSCGIELRAGVRFCSNCGGAIAPPAPAGRPVATPSTAGAGNQNLLPIIAVVLIVGAAAVFFLTRGGGSDDTGSTGVTNDGTGITDKGGGGDRESEAALTDLLLVTPVVPAGFKTGAEATLAGGPDPVLSQAVTSELKKEGLDTNLLKPSVWPIPGTSDNLLVFNTDQNAQTTLTPAQEDAQTNAFRRIPVLPVMKTARIARVVFVIRNFPQAGKTATLSFPLAFLERLGSGVQITEAELKQQVLYQVKP